jgi:hypothetical protein
MTITQLVSVGNVLFNDWIIKGSVANNDTICLVFMNRFTLQCIVRYFTDETKAHKFLEQVINRGFEPTKTKD